MMTAPKMLAIIAVALQLQSYHTKVLVVQTHDGTDNAPEESIKTKSRVASQIKTSKLNTKAGHQSIQNKALGPGIVRGSLNRIVTRSLLAQFWAPPELTNTAFGHPPPLTSESTAHLAVPGRTY